MAYRIRSSIIFEYSASVLGAVSKVDVDFAAVGCAVDKEVGGSGWENWWSGRGAA